MPINFPDSPSSGEVFTSGQRNWQWSGTKWNQISAVSTLGSLADVSIDAAVTGEVVQYDGTGWVNADIIAQIVDSAPGTLNTLNELAAALGNDENFATTVANSLASKASSLEPTITDPTINATALAPGLVDTIYYAATRYDSNFPGGPADQSESIFYMTPNNPPLFSIGDIVTVTGMEDARANLVDAAVHGIDGQAFSVFVGAANALPQGLTVYNVYDSGIDAIATGAPIELSVVVSSQNLATLNGLTTSIQDSLDGKASLTDIPTDIPNITISTSQPSGGNDGDLWLTY